MAEVDARTIVEVAEKVAFEPPEYRQAGDYIDETPVWRDGTPLRQIALTPMQWRIWWLATAGKFFEGMIVFMTGVSHTLIATEFGLSAVGVGLISAATLFGILIGAVTLGGLSDHYGRRNMFIIEMVVFVFFLVVLAFAQSYLVVLIALFGLGVALGCDYPTAHMVISENMPSRERGRLVLGAFSFQAIGALVGTGMCYLVLVWFPFIEAWRYMYAAAIIPAVLVTIGRFYIPESAMWLLEKGRVSEAEKSMTQLLRRYPQYPNRVVLEPPKDVRADKASEGGLASLKALFRERKARRAIMLSSVPWFLQDLGTYGIGIFTPVVLATAFGNAPGHARSTAELVGNDMLAAKGAAMIDVLLIVGIIFAILLADKVGRIRLQVFGFIGCAVGLFVASLGGHLGESMQVPLIFAGFMLFNFMNNLGPNAQTYLIAGEVFPTRFRGAGAGLAASIAKIGAVTTAFLFPVLLAAIGTDALLAGLIITSLIGAWVTWKYRIETRGKALAELD
ncbi:MFS transporter [Roseibium sp. RKSG952]|uniref:MFS transporter n=1 Tax=Roseibium sp. RKSG952 TaxID=2529384 RepID=UPI0012BBB639|nr:MFS transporter [Roseibium sp. RKSG952]MTH99572.1 MFS transporter [Roseibium sp. RKSG952]